MPRFPPTLRGRYGHTFDGAGNVEHTIDITVVAGDMVVITALTSDYLQRARSDGPLWSGGEAFVERGAVYGWQDWANAYTWTARATVSGTFRIYCYFSGGNNGANYTMMRGHVWANSDGIGAQGALRAPGPPRLDFTTQQAASAISFTAVDWNAANGALTLQSGTTQDAYFNGGAAEYFFAYVGDTSTAGGKSIGATSSTNGKWSMAAVEVLGQFRDTTRPSTLSPVATALSSSEIKIDWGTATDDIGVTGYRVTEYNISNGQTTLLAQLGPTIRTWTHSGLQPETTHYYVVTAIDAAGNISNPNNPAGGNSFAKTLPAVPVVNKAFVGLNKPSLRVGTALVKSMYVGNQQVWP